MIKRIGSIALIAIFSFCMMGMVNAAESDFSSVASITSVIGGAEEEIIPIAEGTYKYYYKIQQIDDNDFSTYIKSRYIYDNGDESSDEYMEAQARVDEYETAFNALIPTLNSTSDLNSWTESTDKHIKLTGLNYEANKHHGYIIGVAAVKDGKIYVTRLILESTSASTLEAIKYTSNDKTTYNNNTQQGVVEKEKDTKTESNPETGLEDYAIYLVPLSIVLGSGILLRRSNA